MKGKRGIGESYERKVSEYLQKENYLLIDKNFRYGHYEIDIIALKENVIVFVEVKFRSDAKNFNLYGCVSKQQQENIRKCASAFIDLNPKYKDYFGRFDVFLISKNGGGIKIKHFKNTF